MSSIHKTRWAVVARMNLALMRLSHRSYFPRTLTIAEGLVLRVMLQYAFLWDAEGHPATVSKMSRALGLSRATTKRRLNVLVDLGFVTRKGRYYCCADQMERLQQTQSFYERYATIIAQTHKELVKVGRKSAVPD